MKEQIQKMKLLLYKIKALKIEKQELEEVCGLSACGTGEPHVRGGEKLSAPERNSFMLMDIDNQLQELTNRFRTTLGEFRETLESLKMDSDTKLILEQKLVYEKSWKEIVTTKEMSVSHKKNTFYKTMKSIEQQTKER